MVGLAAILLYAVANRRPMRIYGDSKPNSFSG